MSINPSNPRARKMVARATVRDAIDMLNQRLDDIQGAIEEEQAMEADDERLDQLMEIRENIYMMNSHLQVLRLFEDLRIQPVVGPSPFSPQP